MNTLHSHLVQGMPVQEEEHVYQPCCSPTEFSDLAILYLDGEGGEMIMKNLPKMIVDDCGCA